MKKITFITILLAGSTAFAQINLTPQTQEPPKKKEDAVLTLSEKFMNRQGSLIEKQVIEVGKVKRFNIEVVKLKDLNTGDRYSAITLGTQSLGNLSKGKRASLDEDEVAGFLKSLKILKNDILPSTPTTYSEVKYQSRSFFEAGGFYDERKKSWKLYIHLFNWDSLSFSLLPPDELDELIALVEKAQAEMKN